jgi:hypothetical protein
MAMNTDKKLPIGVLLVALCCCGLSWADGGASLRDKVPELVRELEGAEALRAVKRLQHAYAQYYEAGAGAMWPRCS